MEAYLQSYLLAMMEADAIGELLHGKVRLERAGADRRAVVGLQPAGKGRSRGARARIN